MIGTIELIAVLADKLDLTGGSRTSCPSLDLN